MKRTIAIVFALLAGALLLGGCAKSDEWSKTQVWTVYFGLIDRDGAAVEKAAAKETIDKLCLDNGIGYTVYEAGGAYHKGESIVENVTLVYMLTLADEETMKKVCKEAVNVLNLESVMVQRAETEYQFLTEIGG